MRYNSIPSQLFVKNRKKLLNLISDNSLVILLSADPMPRNGDLTYPYRQNSDFFYLTGIEQENSRLLLAKKGNVLVEKLFILEPDENMVIWEGEKLSVQMAANISGISDVQYLNSFDEIQNEYLSNIKTVYLNKNENPRFKSSLKTSDLILFETLSAKFNDSVKSLAPLMLELRVRKEPEEIELIKHACNITAGSFNRVLEITRPGIKEFEIEAAITHHFISSGASGHAYEPIIASGKNSCYLHYIKNDKTLENGDIVLLDFGCEYANYASDCSRVIPANGKFTSRQKEVYSAVLDIMKKCKLLIKPGVSILNYHKQVSSYTEEACINLGLFSKADAKKQNPAKPLYQKYFMHGVSHFMGLDTHDLGTKDMLLEPGMIVTCEPGIYIPDEKIGIRLENDILVTNSGNIDLMENIPIEIDDIENIMSRNQKIKQSL